MIGPFINGSQSVIPRQRRPSPYGHVTKQTFVKFVNSSRRTLARVLYVRVRSHCVPIDKLMILMNLYYLIEIKSLRPLDRLWSFLPDLTNMIPVRQVRR